MKKVISLLLFLSVLCVFATASGEPLNVSVGDIITYGHYPQTEKGTDNTPIEWIVLDVQDGKALVISRYGLDAKPYNEEYADITWEKCPLRTWLNSDFLNAAFSTEEQAAILVTDVDNSDSQGFDWVPVLGMFISENPSGGNNTQDRIFLLSYAEVNRYFEVTYDSSNNRKARVEPTEYALKAGAYTSRNDKTESRAAAGWWWLRSPGHNLSNAAVVDCGGELRRSGVDSGSGCVRPALWINLDSDIF